MREKIYLHVNWDNWQQQLSINLIQVDQYRGNCNDSLAVLSYL